jgi:uncharacterized protein YbaA (DUF1428 family)
MNIKEVKQEKFDEVVAKFQKYGIGLVMTGYIAADAENATLWHELVYPNRVTGRHIFDLSRIKNQYFKLFKKAKDVTGLADALGEDEIGPDVAFSVLDEYKRDVHVTWEELAIFAYAAYKARKTSDAYAKKLTKAKAAKENLNKNMTAEQKRERDQKLIEEFEKEFGEGVLADDDDI